MKKLFTLILLIYASAASAQWSDVNNQFFDSLHMPVSIVTNVQKNPIIVQSYPDGGYFVIWEDDRNVAVTNTDIYAQKYDKTGKRLWADNGVPVSNGPYREQYTLSSNQDYRNRSVAATDSAGGFYIAYYDDSVTNYSWYRMCVQHMKSNGNAVFGAAGFIAAQSVPNNGSTFSAPFLIADGNKGFYLSYVQTYSNDYVEVYDYRDENGTMKLYGGGKV
ncbi:MAG: hypothetical protein ABIN97_13775, partial [Ginsengibacter sp.]